jgi:hypothetical protein
VSTAPLAGGCVVLATATVGLLGACTADVVGAESLLHAASTSIKAERSTRTLLAFMDDLPVDDQDLEPPKPQRYRSLAPTKTIGSNSTNQRVNSWLFPVATGTTP